MLTKSKNNSFKDIKSRNQYWITLLVLSVLAIIFALGLLVYNNPVPIDSPSFIPIVRRRINAIIAMAIASLCHSISTISFQTITNNKIITPSLLGFEALYSTIQTATLYFFGLTALINFSGNFAFLVQLFLMILFCMILYGSLLFRKNHNIQLLLLIGIVLGSGLRSFSSFMSRLISPSEFDILQARLFASVNNAHSESFPIAIPIVLISYTAIYLNSNKLNVFSLGKDIAINLGLNHKKMSIITLVLISILMAVSTALIGPLTFLGFLVAMITYQITPTHDHKYILPMSAILSFLILASSYFIMNHVFYAQGVVSIIIELLGGSAFLYMLLRKGSL